MMPVEGIHFGYKKMRAEARKMKKQYWINKGCSERKAEDLLYRYGY